MAPPPLDDRRAESACHHVRALNTQFASWVQSQLQNHPDELWEDGVQDYLNHASHILEKFKDVVDWLKENAGKNDVSVLPLTPSLLPAGKNELTFQANNGKNLMPTFTGFVPSSTTSTTSLWGFNSLENIQRSGFSGSQSFTTEAVTSDDLIEEAERPSSPSVKKIEEKGVIVVHEAKCKVYVKPDNPGETGWKDMGVGQLSIRCNEGANKATKESKPTVVVRSDVGKVLLNALIYRGIKMNVQKNSITTIFHTAGTGNKENGDNAGVMARTYILRLKTEEDTNKLATAIKEFSPVE